MGCIVNGGSYRAVDWWTNHLQSKDNDSAELVNSYGLRSEDIRGMLGEMTDLAQGTKCQNPFYQMNINPEPGERLTPEQWDRAREIAEKHHGLEGQPYFVIEHVKHGRLHQHIVWSRIDLERGRAISDSHDARKNHAIGREIAVEFGLKKVLGPYDREPEIPRPPHSPKPWEMYRDKKHGLDTRDITAEVPELRQQSGSGQAFALALKSHGYELTTGRRGLLILDSAGNEHSLARRCGLAAKELNAFMREVDRAALPTVEQAKEQYQERKIAELEADRATVRDEIQWEQALERTAIEKEERERRFVEVDAETRGGATAAKKQEPQRGTDIPVLAAIRNFEQSLMQEPDTVELLKQEIAEIDRLLYGSTIDDRKLYLEEIDEFLAAELFQRWKGDPNRFGEKWQAQLAQLPPGIAAAVEELIAWQEAFPEVAIQLDHLDSGHSEPETRAGQENIDRSPLPAAPELGKTQGEIRLARTLSPGPQSFTEALRERDLLLSRVTAEDIARDMARLRGEWEQRRLNPQSWMEHEGGYDKLKPDLQESARRSFDAWKERQRQKQRDAPPAFTLPEPTAEELQKSLRTTLNTFSANGPKAHGRTWRRRPAALLLSPVTAAPLF